MRRREPSQPARVGSHPAAAGLLLAALVACGPGPTPPSRVAGAQESATAATGEGEAEAAGVPPPALLDGRDGPSLFLTADEDAPAVGYAADGLPVTPAGPPSHGRVLVRIEGPMRVQAYAPVERLFLRVQRRGRVRGAPMYVGPDDRVRVLGPDEEPGRLRVAVRARLGTGWSDSYAGSFPTVGLAATPAPADAEPPPPGQPHALPAGQGLTLYDRPGGSAVAGLPPQRAPIAVQVLGEADGWRAVRVGEGPYLIGYTADALEAGNVASQAPPEQPSAEGDGVPARIAREQGELKRVRSGAKLRFNGAIIAVFKQDGWARVLQTYPGGQADVFAAADDRVAVRGLLDVSLLFDPAADDDAGSSGSE